MNFFYENGGGGGGGVSRNFLSGWKGYEIFVNMF